eukprot:2565215-Rhodomonas_salina.1
MFEKPQKSRPWLRVGLQREVLGGVQMLAAHQDSQVQQAEVVQNRRQIWSMTMTLVLVDVTADYDATESEPEASSELQQ